MGTIIVVAAVFVIHIETNIVVKDIENNNLYWENMICYNEIDKTPISGQHKAENVITCNENSPHNEWHDALILYVILIVL